MTSFSSVTLINLINTLLAEIFLINWGSTLLRVFTILSSSYIPTNSKFQRKVQNLGKDNMCKDVLLKPYDLHISQKIACKCVCVSSIYLAI